MILYTHTHTDNLKNRRGITLIALVITIIVLLVLAGVTITMISGDNGILKKVVQAKESTQKASVEEKVRLAIQSAFASDYSKNGKITQETLTQELEKNGLSEENLEEIEDGKWVLSENGKKYLIYSDGNIEIKQSRLPLGYKELEYIESTGTQYIDTNVLGKNNILVDSNLSIEGYTSYDTLIGAIDSSGSKRIYAMIGYNEKLALGINDQYYVENKLSNNQKNHLIYIFQNNNSKIILNGEDIIQDTTQIIPTLDRTFYMFANHWQSGIGGYSKIKLYDLKIFDDYDLICDFIPCKNQQGEIGMFDTISCTFFENKGTGDFIAGPEIE